MFGLTNMEFNIWPLSQCLSLSLFSLSCVCLCISFGSHRRTDGKGNKAKNARAGKALLKTTVAFVKLMGIKFRGGGGADGRSSGSPQGLSASAPALGAATKNPRPLGQSSRWTHQEEVPDCKTGLGSSEKEVTDS